MNSPSLGSPRAPRSSQRGARSSSVCCFGMKCAIVIPARMESTRFPGKPLADLAGKPMVQWVYEAAVAADCADDVVVATPNEEIARACRSFGAECILTSKECPSGTDRVAEVARNIPHDVFVNVQGDEPLLPPETIRACLAPLTRAGRRGVASVYDHCSPEELDDPAVVKVATDLEDRALYFSRWPIPFPRNERTRPVKKHVGLYAYERESLLAFASWEPSPLESAEGLEQLRFLEHGVTISMTAARGSPLAVDTPEQARRVSEILARRERGDAQGHRDDGPRGTT